MTNLYLCNLLISTTFNKEMKDEVLGARRSNINIHILLHTITLKYIR